MPAEQQIQQLKEALFEIVTAIDQADLMDDEEIIGLLAQVMEHVARRIQELRPQEQQEPQGAPVPPAPPQAPQIEPGPFPSSNINGFDYDYKTGKLLVKFNGRTVRDNGPTYSYEGVPRFIFDIFRRGAVPPRTSGRNRWHRWERGKMPSLGAAMYHLIRTNYPYQRVA